MINKKRILDKFLEYVQIDSETKNEKEFMNTLVTELQELGLDVEIGNEGEKCGSNGNNIYARLVGESTSAPILLSAHMDTVTPGNGIKPTVEGDYVVTDGTTILGGDDKAGISVIMEAIRSIIENNTSHRTIEVLFTIFEEGGLFGSKYADYSKISAKNCIVFDSDGKTGQIITQAPAQNKIVAKIYGKPAHAGVAPEEGISALSIAADAINNMKLLRVDEDTTANFGKINGGSATNIVMPELIMIGEARSLSNEKLKIQTDHMCEVLEKSAEKFGGKVDIDVSHAYSALNIEKDDEFLQELTETLSSLGHEVIYKSTGGGSDANNMFQNGIKCVNIPCGMEKVHTKEERLNINRMNEAAEFLIKYLTK